LLCFPARRRCDKGIIWRKKQGIVFVSAEVDFLSPAAESSEAEVDMIRSNGTGTRIAARVGKHMDVPKLVESFVRSGRIANKSQHTLTWYERRLAQFVAFLQNTGHSMRGVDVTKADGEAYIEHLMNRTSRWQSHPFQKRQTEGGLSPYTIHGHVRALRAMTHWAKDEGYLPADPFETLRPPKLPVRLYEIYSEEELERVLAYAGKDDIRCKRMRTILMILLDTGIRAMELATLKLAHVDLQNGTLKVTGKGNKERYVPIGEVTMREIDTYIHFYRPRPATPEVDTLLLNEDGLPYTYSALSSMMARLRKALGLKRLHMHKFRHTSFTKMIENGIPSFVVQQWAGHTSPMVTNGYVHLAQQRTAERFRGGSVVDKLGSAQAMQRRGRKPTQSD
jgi:site-specific recombinase XerD